MRYRRRLRHFKLHQQLHNSQRSNIDNSPRQYHQQLHLPSAIGKTDQRPCGQLRKEDGTFFFYKLYGLKSCMIGVFTIILPDGVNWTKFATMLAQEVDRQADVLGENRVEIRPVKFGFEDKSGAQTTTVVAVYAPVVIMAEVKGICNHLALDKTDKEGFGLSGSQFHTTVNLQKITNSRNIILLSHANFFHNYSACTVSADTHNLDERAPTALCKELLPTTFHIAKDIQTKRNLLYAFLRHEHRAEFTNVQTFLYPRGEEGFRFTAPANKTIFKLEDIFHHFSYSGFRKSWPAECHMYNASSDNSAERMSIFKSTQQRNTTIHKEANRPPPSSYSAAAVPQQRKQAKVSQARPTPVQNQITIKFRMNNLQICAPMYIRYANKLVMLLHSKNQSSPPSTNIYSTKANNLRSNASKPNSSTNKTNIFNSKYNSSP